LLGRREKNGWPQVNPPGSHPRGGADAGIAAAGCSAGVEDRQRHRSGGEMQVREDKAARGKRENFKKEIIVRKIK
jgi:hypothetical protein